MTQTTQTLTNTEILIFILGKQGGTVHQVAKQLGVAASEIINANYDQMQDLARAAQVCRTQELYNIFRSYDETISPIAAIRRMAIAERDAKEEA